MAVYLMAHDLGTTGNKATLFSVDGTYPRPLATIISISSFPPLETVAIT